MLSTATSSSGYGGAGGRARTPGLQNTDASVPFTGIRKRVSTEGLSEDAFTSLNAGESLELDIDIGAVHEFGDGGLFKLNTYGAIPYAEIGSTALVPGRALAYSSNEIEVNIDGAKAALVPRAFDLSKRSRVQTNTCTAAQRTALNTALRNCQQLSSAAATAASSGSASKSV